MSTLYLCAAGNPEGVRLALAVNAAENRWSRIVLVDDDPAKHGRTILGVEVIGSFDRLADHRPGDEAVNLVARTTDGRRRAGAKIEGFGLPLTSLVHPSVDIFGAELGRAVTIYPQCTISALSTMGDGAVVFGHAVLGHGATLGAGAVLAPGAVVNARVNVGELAYVGSNASILPDLNVGRGATIGACSSVVSDVPDGVTALGVPAEILGGELAASTRPPRARARASEPSRDHVLVVRRMFAEVLEREEIGLDDNFFDLGGTSARALMLRRALETALGVSVAVVDVFRAPTARRLAELLAPPSGASDPVIDPASFRAQMRMRRRAAL